MRTKCRGTLAPLCTCGDASTRGTRTLFDRMTETAHSPNAPQPRAQLTPRRIAIVLVVAVAVAVLVWLLVRGGGSSSNGAATTATSTTASVTPLGPVVATQATLVAFAAALKRPIYWVGPQPGFRYEFTETSAGNIYVRYLPRGVRVGDPRAAFRVVATYPYPDALSRLGKIAGTSGQRLTGGALIVPSAKYPKSVHMAFPGSPYEIEVFDPVPGQARTIALSGRVRPVR
jgi:hypothetical protein